MVASESGRNPLGIALREVVCQIVLVNTVEHAQEGPQCGASILAISAMHLTNATSIIISRSFVLAVVDHRVSRQHAVLAPIIIRVDYCASRWNGLSNDAIVGGTIGISDHPTTIFAGLTANTMDGVMLVIVHRS